jgi:DNA-binding NarL/FixJ family response regulator
MTKSCVRILLVDDFVPWRRRVCAMLQKHRELQVIAEVGDGLEAVQKAGKLKPDLILLDIGLPKLNGLEAASRIREVAPDAAIIFLTENNDKDIAQAALSAGARGYVLKTDAGKELLRAVAGVLAGNVFVSSAFAADFSQAKHK